MSNLLQVIGFGVGTTELLIILAIFVFIFGASRIPELGRSLGSGIRGFQKAIKGDDEKKQLEQGGANAASTPGSSGATSTPDNTNTSTTSSSSTPSDSTSSNKE